MWPLLLLPLHHHCPHSGTRSSRDSVSCGWNILSPGFCTCCLLCPQCPPEAPLLQRPTCLPFKAQPHCPALFLECSFLLVSLEGLMPPGAGHPCAGPHFSRGHTFFLWFSYSTTVHISPWFQIPRGHWVPRPGPLPPQSYEATGPILQGQRTVAKRGKWLGLIPSSAIPTSVSLGK